MILPLFREVWCVDFEFRGAEGDRPSPVCMVAYEFRSGRTIRLWYDDLKRLSAAPFSTGADCLFVAYFASAELGCFLSLGWPLPRNIVDLFVEHRVATNGWDLPFGNSLIGAAALRGLDALDAGTKDAMRSLVLQQASWTAEEQSAILDYCAADARILGLLLRRMAEQIDLPRALLRGRYMAAVARMEHTGIPLDTALWRALSAVWEPLKERLIEAVDAGFGVYDGTRFDSKRFDAWLCRAGIPWPRFPSGALQLDGDTFRDQSLTYPQVAALHQLRQTTAQLRLTGLKVGADGRNRTLLSPFRTITGRNSPSNAKFIFGPATWMRGLIRSPAGMGLAYVDWSAQEIAVAAALSGDAAMIDGYASGDPHIAFAKMAGLVPSDATAQTHPQMRACCKTVNLGVNYGMSAIGLAARLGITPAAAHELLQQHHNTYRRFWQWVEEITTAAMLSNRLVARFGWQTHVTSNSKPRSLQNWPAQANGSEMMRIAAIAATEGGIEVCAPIHDAFLIVAPLEELDDTVRLMRRLMERAGEAVTGGLAVRTDAKVVRYPERYMDDRGVAMWDRVMGLLTELSPAASAL
jgi:hypothetical protein